MIGPRITMEKIKELIRQVKQRIDIVRVIGQRIRLNGQNKTICPFHKEKTPSFSVHREIEKGGII